ncbi:MULTISPECIES: imidazoleglycerol-phosphate dehydratase HisB [Thermococcus]|uniref:Imidazoleglycerol-phosphate dehydratase n=1 Tax=Thermococcus sibiricus TaxID=172049 RepID=A0A101EM74_9EURY|nr:MULTISPECIES: imidazoleglycerol-phosphate dehydratase HisB [Thermococcus]KUK17915.1 MAG: Imidazoleglycerol-phosphate dehydratase [Thermococcus sibiricus]KUK29344.1 MAG: Imidazoleglycerol-phosphate dehydratase [Thermococcus sp. 40_45]MBC7094648.1 imidazoleglycerol-phosphate dehydratase HisB [Thermococcus sp.]HII67874.1 imidazoleglycerol-phosphate dehydratase HisB [Thermococcaceae archaeon]
MKRKTKETDITVEIDVNGSIETGDRIFNHLLTALFFYLHEKVNIKASYDLRHHLWEDLGIVLGEELREKIKGKKIARFGSAIIPMDDALVLVAVDISRPYLNLELDIKESEEGFEVTLVREFLWALARTLNATIHVKQLSGVNAHHIIEAAFKGLGVVLRQALSESERLESTKGVL